MSVVSNISSVYGKTGGLVFTTAGCKAALAFGTADGAADIPVAVAYYLSGIYGFSLITAFLAMAPGGIAEMCLAGMSMGENVSIILTYQLVRMLILNITVPMGLTWYFKDK